MTNKALPDRGFKFWLLLILSVLIVFPTISVSADAASGIRINVNTSMTSQYQGSKITVKAVGSGGTAPYQYKFIYKIGSGSWVTVRNYSTSASSGFTASKAGTYTVRSYTKDKSGREIHCDISIPIKQKYVSPTNKSTISAYTINRYGSLTVKGIGSGGTAPYSFKYYFVDQQGVTKVIKNYSAVSSVNFKIYYGGYYTVHCTMKDKDGKVLDKAFNVTVKYNTNEAFKNTSWLSSSSVFSGSSITITARNSGGYQPIQYSYYYSENGSAYKKISGYVKNAKQAFNPTTAGYYKIKIISKDFSGKTSEIIKDLTVKKNTNKALALNASLNTTALVDQNTTVTISASGSGGTMPYKYAYHYKIANGQWKTIKGFSTSEKVSLKITGRGLYTIKAVVRDEAGKTVEKLLRITSIAKITSSSVSDGIRSQYGLTASYTVKYGGSGAQYEIYYRNPGSTQWTKLQSYSTNRSLNLRPRYLGETTYLVYTKLSGNVTTSYFKVTASIPEVVYTEFSIINAERKKAGLSELKLDTNLVFVANVRTEELEKSYSHTRPNGTKCFTILEEYDIKSPTVSGENIAWGYPDVASVVDGWMNSSDHRANLLNSKYNKIGIGNNGKYWTQMFTS